MAHTSQIHVTFSSKQMQEAVNRYMKVHLTEESAVAKSLEDTVAAYLRKTGTWTESPGAPLLRWVDERRKQRDGAGVAAVDVVEAFRRQLTYELNDAGL